MNLLKLVGAGYVFKARIINDDAFIFCKKCWSKDMALRCESTAQILKIPVQMSEWSINMFGTASELKTMETMEQL